MPNMVDPQFAQTVTLICSHNDQGSLGVIINQPMGIRCSDVLEQLDIKIEQALDDSWVYAGGPVHSEVGLILHPPEGNWESTLSISNHIAITSSKDILTAMGQGKAPPKTQLILGYAGWYPGQLEKELADNCWLTAPADSHIVFDVPHEDRWNEAIKSLGIDLAHLSNQTGHA